MVQMYKFDHMTILLREACNEQECQRTRTSTVSGWYLDVCSQGALIFCAPLAAYGRETSSRFLHESRGMSA